MFHSILYFRNNIKFYFSDLIYRLRKVICWICRSKMNSAVYGKAKSMNIVITTSNGLMILVCPQPIISPNEPWEGSNPRWRFLVSLLQLIQLQIMLPLEPTLKSAEETVLMKWKHWSFFVMVNHLASLRFLGTKNSISSMIGPHHPFRIAITLTECE